MTIASSRYTDEGLPLDRSRRVALTSELEPASRRALEEFKKRFRLPGRFAHRVEFFSADDDDRFSLLLHNALRAIGT